MRGPRQEEGIECSSTTGSLYVGLVLNNGRTLLNKRDKVEVSCWGKQHWGCRLKGPCIYTSRSTGLLIQRLWYMSHVFDESSVTRLCTAMLRSHMVSWYVISVIKVTCCQGLMPRCQWMMSNPPWQVDLSSLTWHVKNKISQRVCLCMWSKL